MNRMSFIILIVGILLAMALCTIPASAEELPIGLSAVWVHPAQGAPFAAGRAFFVPFPDKPIWKHVQVGALVRGVDNFNDLNPEAGVTVVDLFKTLHLGLAVLPADMGWWGWDTSLSFGKQGEPILTLVPVYARRLDGLGLQYMIRQSGGSVTYSRGLVKAEYGFTF